MDTGARGSELREGAEVLVLMSDGAVLTYTVTEVHPNISCPDDRAAPHPNPPLALKYAPPGCVEGAAWTQPTDHERLTHRWFAV